MVRHLVFRCPHCRAVTELDAHWEGGESSEIRCSNCEAKLVLAADLDRGKTQAEYRSSILSLASKHRIDHASACSLYEGILPLERIRTIPSVTVALERRAHPMAFRLALLMFLLVAVIALALQIRATHRPRASLHSSAETKTPSPTEGDGARVAT